MNLNEVIKLLESLKGETHGEMQSMTEVKYEIIFNKRIDKEIVKLKKNNQYRFTSWDGSLGDDCGDANEY